MPDDDLVAVKQLRNGDIKGLETLVYFYQVKAMRAAFLILRDEQLAEDVVQDTFLRLFKHIHRFDERRPFGPYLLRSVVNAALDAAQRESKQEQVSDQLEIIERLLQHAMTVEAQAEFNTVKHDIHRALEAISPRQRAAVVMRYYLGMSEKDMAEILNVRPGTVKWLLNAARERLRIILGRKWSTK